MRLHLYISSEGSAYIFMRETCLRAGMRKLHSILEELFLISVSVSLAYRFTCLFPHMKLLELPFIPHPFQCTTETFSSLLLNLPKNHVLTKIFWSMKRNNLSLVSSILFKVISLEKGCHYKGVFWVFNMYASFMLVSGCWCICIIKVDGWMHKRIPTCLIDSYVHTIFFHAYMHMSHSLSFFPRFLLVS